MVLYSLFSKSVKLLQLNSSAKPPPAPKQPIQTGQTSDLLPVQSMQSMLGAGLCSLLSY